MIRRLNKIIIVVFIALLLSLTCSCKKEESTFEIINCDDVYKYDSKIELSFIAYSEDKKFDFNKVNLIALNDNISVSDFKITYSDNSTYTFSYAYMHVVYTPSASNIAITKLIFQTSGSDYITKYIDGISFIDGENENTEVINKFSYNEFLFNGKATLPLTLKRDDVESIQIETFNKANCKTSYIKENDTYYLTLEYSYQDYIHYYYGFGVYIYFKDNSVTKDYVITTPQSSLMPVELISAALKQKNNN